MAIQKRNKLNIAFNPAPMSDLVFLLLIFFVISSTLVSPNAIKLLLPSSKSKTMAKQAITVYINDHFEYFVDPDGRGHAVPVNLPQLQQILAENLQKQDIDASVVLRADQSVPVQYVVSLFDIVNDINTQLNSKYKVILATRPVKEIQ
ncbi:MAG TPA: biopolymer transporter ExbD [Bacteroidales bacterium]|jgi:biopolymer transport protein ExbD|nr:biopolymer transporter ExbD [Bacteroidales bacterium]MDI9573374.1 biopolymer transporter ExbD [Bacteroidota bacterium]OQC60292.1 MAG: Biopolymer transport protein ExbD/TolR [Bacteroidetes bacterium ADurb.Bin012]MBP9511397.1 biopolymer transporter ExbD [Bacteroidales bacterium]MBP9587637.1 biopolymer transporter ExbD [Bacteroidales bacterium]